MEIKADACVPAGQDPSTYCRSQGAAFFGAPGGGYACNKLYPQGYKQICSQEFGIEVGHVIGSTASGGSYRTVSQADLQKCMSGTPPAAPSCNPSQGTWKSTGGRDSVEACICSDNSVANVSEAECGSNANKKKEATCSKPNEVQNANKDGCDCKPGYERTTDEAALCVTPSSNPTTASNGADQALVDCVKKYDDMAKSCADYGKQAKATCDQANSDNKGVAEAERVAGQAGDQIVQANAQQAQAGQKKQGMISTCIIAAATSNSSKIALEETKKTCDTNYEECSKSCGEDKLNEMAQVCAPIANAASANSAANIQYYKQKLAAIRQNQELGIPLCKEGKSNQDLLGQVLDGVGKSLLAGMSCVCKVTSNMTGGNCSNFPTAAQCAANPALAGCPAVVATDVCTMGSANYNADSCKCVQNPTAAGCPQALAANPALSGFAGVNVPSTAGGAGGVDIGSGSSGPGGSTSGIDLSGMKAADVAPSKGSGQLGAGFTGGGGAGGGGGGLGAPGGGGDGGGAGGGDGEGKASGLGAIFGQAKSIVGNMLGIGAQKGVMKLDSKADMDKFRPKSALRGIASGSDVGGKNMDIWKMMNNRYDLNQSTFIPTP